MTNSSFIRPLSPRSEKFLKNAETRAKSAQHSNRVDSWMNAFQNIYKDDSSARRLALTFAYALTNEPVYVYDDELITGIFYFAEGFGIPEVWTLGGSIPSMYNNYFGRIGRELPEHIQLSGMVDFKPEVRTNETKAAIASMLCSPGHIAWHWDWIVADGVEGMLERTAKALPDTDARGKEVIECMEICLKGMLTWSESHLEVFKTRLAGAASESERNWLRERIEVCRRVPRHGARNFREAVQAFNFAYLSGFFECPHGGNSPGRLDYYLWPYLERDLSNNVITLDQARELIDELFIRFHEKRCWGADGSVETIVLAGSNPDGSSAANPLSRIMIESFASLKGLTHPSIYVRMPENPPEWLKDISVQYLLYGGNRAQIINDKAVITAMTIDGDMPVEHARDYMCGGCMELSSFAKSGDLLFTKFFNVAKVLEYVITGGVCLRTGRKVHPHLGDGLISCTSFEEFYAAFEHELARTLEISFKGMDICAQEYAQCRPAFLVSSMVEDCIGRGRTINDGGALYEDFGSTPLGIPNAADSLIAIKKAIFEEKFVDAVTLLAAMNSDFAGHASLRLKLRTLPKYGQGDKEADTLMNRVVTSVCDIYAKRKNILGGKFKPMIMTFMMAPIEGDKLGASPDGRHAGTPIAQGITPQSASMTQGIGTAMLSASSVSIDRFSGGASHIWDIDPSLSKPAIVKNLIDVFFSRGGQMFQGNTLDIKSLKEAQADPEKYPHLTVRVGGYSATFVNLQKENQEEIIERIHHTC